MASTPKRKLIEVSLPLEAINREATRENYIYKGNPSSVHKWWAQRPLSTARCVLFAQLVDDPSSHPDRFPTEELQRLERERLHGIIARLAPWEATLDERTLEEARREIIASTGDNPPCILDPFAGGGTIPLEAQRLGLRTHASDLNPVAVLINKALLQIPPLFAGHPPVHPSAQNKLVATQRTQGLSADIIAYGEWMFHEGKRRIGHLYPDAQLHDGTRAQAIAWIWARTVACPNPACGIEMPLVRSWWLGKKKSNTAYVVPSIVDDPSHPSGRRVRFEISDDRSAVPTDGTVGRTGARCLACQTAVSLEYIRQEGQEQRMAAQLMAVVAEAKRRRVYLPASQTHQVAADLPTPDNIPTAPLPAQAPGFRVQAYGMTQWVDLFTARQLAALSTFSDLIQEARARVLRDALAAGTEEGPGLDDGGSGATAYADAVATYLSFALSKLADYSNKLAVWYPTEDRPKNLFARQSVPMVWDFPELNPFCDIGGSWRRGVEIVAESLSTLAPSDAPSMVAQKDAARLEIAGSIISTDPPYYDNIGYSDLSDFFYVWLRRSIRPIFPELLGTMLVPKSEELVANSFRHKGTQKANIFFEEGFRNVFAHARNGASTDFPITVYYAFKQSEKSESGESSSGWQTLLDGMISSGWSITATWPMRSERGGRMVAVASNALASSIVIALRPRSEHAPTTDRRGFIAALQSELPEALRKLQQGAIAPVDLPQAAIGPGMAVFSRYSSVLEPDGAPMSVRSALERINEILDQVLAEQETDFDTTTRFAIAWYRQHGYGTGKYGDADNLARARNTAVNALDRYGILSSRAGNVTLLSPSALDETYDVVTDAKVSTWEVLHHLIRALELDGIIGAGRFLADALSHPSGEVEGDLITELGHLLFRVAEKRGWTKDAIAFNSIVTSWPDIAAAADARPTSTQDAFIFSED